MSRPDENFTQRVDTIEPGDKSALICIDVASVQRQIVDALVALGYKVHTALFQEDGELKIHTNVYDMVVVSENYNSTTPETNTFLKFASVTPPAQRRRQMYVLIGSTLHTDSEMEAWTFNVDLVVNANDAPHFQTIMRRAAIRYQNFYKPYIDALTETGAVG